MIGTSAITFTLESVSKFPLSTLESLLKERGITCTNCVEIDEYATLFLESQHLPIIIQRNQKKLPTVPPLSKHVSVLWIPD
jgi:hypothetical protein